MQGLWILEFIPNATEVTEEPAGGKLDILICFSELNLLCVEVVVYLLTHARLCNPTDGSLPAPLSMEFSRQEYWSGFPFSSFILLLHSVTLSTFYFFFKAYLFCLCWVVIAVSWLSRVTAAVHRLQIAVASLVLEHRL